MTKCIGSIEAAEEIMAQSIMTDEAHQARVEINWRTMSFTEIVKLLRQREDQERAERLVRKP